MEGVSCKKLLTETHNAILGIQVSQIPFKNFFLSFPVGMFKRATENLYDEYAKLVPT